MKTRNILITLFIVLVMVFGIVGCNSGNDLQSKIDGLQSRIEELEEQLRERDATIEELNERIREQDEKIEQLEEELAEKAEGTFYSLYYAYDNGFLDRNDIMHISYYLEGSVHDENGNTVDFVPEKALSTLPKRIENEIKTVYFNTYPQGFQDGKGNYIYGKEILNVKFLGEYNNYYVVIIDSDLWLHGTVGFSINIDGIVWTMSGAPIRVFSYNV